MSDTNPFLSEPVAPFGDLENKSLDRGDVETKDADAPEPRATVTVPVKMIHHADHDGRQLLPGVVYELPSHVARSFVTNKRAVRV